MRNLKLLCASASVFACIGSVSAHAQDTALDDPDQADPGMQAETDTRAQDAAEAAQGNVIVVTARRREENLLDVPVAVSALTSDAIAATGVKNITEISAFTPGLVSEPQGTGGLPDRSANRLIFRGLATSPGEIFINGAPYTGTNSPDVTDIARFEVLTGPQSVYFGRSTFAGAINYVTKAPEDYFSGRVSAEIGTDDLYEFRGTIEGPIIPDGILNARLSARHFEFGGQYTNPNSGLPLGEQQTDNFSLALGSEPSSNVSISLYYSYSVDKDSQPPTYKLRTFGTGPLLDDDLGGVTTGDGLFTPPGLSNPYYLGALPDLADLDPALIGENIVFSDFVRDVYVNNSSNNPLFGVGPSLNQFGLKRKIHHLNGRIDVETDGGWQFALLGSFTNTRSTNIRGILGQDTSNIANPFPVFFGDGNNDTISLSAIAQRDRSDAFGEVRISSPQNARIRGTVGASYFETWGEPIVGFGITNVGVLGPFGEGGSDFGNKTPAVFGGLYFDVTDALTISAEARYQWDKIEEENVLAAPGTILNETFRSFSPRVTIDYEVSPDHLVYATYSRGNNPGGFNTALLELTPAEIALLPDGAANLSFDEEELENFEIGHKGNWANGRIQTTLAAYLMKLTNGQVNDSLFSGGTLVDVTTNVGKVDLWGVEFTGNLMVSDNLSIAGTFDYNDNDIKQFVYPDGTFILGTTNVNGNMLDHVSKMKFSLSPTYTVDLNPDWKSSLRVDWLYRSKFFIDPSNTAFIPGRHLVNARLGFEYRDSVQIELFVKNLFDDDTVTEGVRAPETLYSIAPPALVPSITQINSIVLGLPEKRTAGAKVTFSF